MSELLGPNAPGDGSRSAAESRGTIGAAGVAPPDPRRGEAPHSFGERLLGAIRLDPATYAEVHRDPNALGQAAGVVALGALVQAAGVFQQHGELISLGRMRGALAALELATSFGGWFFSAAAIWVVGVKLMKRPSDLPGLLRVLGFAAAPQILYVATNLGLGFADWMLWLGVWLWTMAAFVAALQAALEVSSGMATVVCVGAGLLSLAAVTLAGGAIFELVRAAIG